MDKRKARGENLKKKKSALTELRKQIDALDRKIMRLIDERMEVALKISQYKEKISDPEREKAVLQNLKKLRLRLLRQEFIVKLAREIIRESKAIQRKRRFMLK